MAPKNLWIEVTCDNEQAERFYTVMKEVITVVFECERRRLGINFRFPKWAIQSALVITFMLLMLLLM